MSVFKFESDRKNVFWQTLMVTPTTSIIFDEARDAVQRLAQLKCSQAVLGEAQKSVSELCSNSEEPSMFLTHEEFAERAQDVLKTVSLKLCEFAAKEVQTPPPQEPPPVPRIPGTPTLESQIAEPLNSFLGNLKRVDLEGDTSLAAGWLKVVEKLTSMQHGGDRADVEKLKDIHTKFVSIFKACMEVVEKINVVLVEGKRAKIEVEPAVLAWSKSLELRETTCRAVDLFGNCRGWIAVIEPEEFTGSLDDLCEVSRLMREASEFESKHRQEVWASFPGSAHSAKFVEVLAGAEEWIEKAMAHGYTASLDGFRDALTPRALGLMMCYHEYVWVDADFIPDGAPEDLLKRIAAAVVPDTKGIEYMAVKKANNADIVAIKGYALLDKARIVSAKAQLASLPDLPLPEDQGNDPVAFGKLIINQHVLKQLVLLKDLCAITTELGSFVKENGKKFTTDFSCNPSLGANYIVVYNFVCLVWFLFFCKQI